MGRVGGWHAALTAVSAGEIAESAVDDEGFLTLAEGLHNCGCIIGGFEKTLVFAGMQDAGRADTQLYESVRYLLLLACERAVWRGVGARVLGPACTKRGCGGVCGVLTSRWVG